MSKVSFLRWLRSGASAGIEASGDAGRASVDVSLNWSVRKSGGDPGEEATPKTPILLFGPGDVTGIDARQVIRTNPVAGAVDFEPELLAHVEFDRAELPWLFTPTPPLPDDGKGPDNARVGGTLTPWLALIVLERLEGVQIVPGEPLPRLVIGAEADSERKRVPDIDELHAWAHVQIAGEPSEDPVTWIRDPIASRSRVVCPRRLAPGRRYLACVVPTFRSGVQVGMGQEPTAKAAERAWGADGLVGTIPVYYSWEFSTAPEGKFEDLVRRLQPFVPPESTTTELGVRSFDASSPGFDLTPPGPGTSLSMGGALGSGESDRLSETVTEKLADMVSKTTALVPPAYGVWHAGRYGSGLSPKSADEGWLEELNLTPGHRIAAGLGTGVVQTLQEELMAACWDQMGEILRANAILRRGHLAIAASQRIHLRHLAPSASEPTRVFRNLGAASGRTLLSAGSTFAGRVGASCLPLATTSGVYRRVLRNGGPLGRRINLIRHEIDDGFVDLGGALSQELNTGHRAEPAAEPWFTLDQFRDAVDRAGVELDSLTSILARLAAASATAACEPLDLAATRDELVVAVDPNAVIPQRILKRLDLGQLNRDVNPRSDQIMAHPRITTPMYEELVALGPDWLLPGIGLIGRNRVLVLDVNSAFVEAFMAGLNHEMCRELLWRGFPTDQRATVFQVFWDRRGGYAPDKGGNDIPEMFEWDLESRLGSAMSGEVGDQVVLLIRGDLLDRYPLTSIYLRRGDGTDPLTRRPATLASSADWENPELVRYPTFRGRIGTDTVFIGFDLPGRTQAMRGSPGWYVVFEEPLGEPRFGLAQESEAFDTWNDLTWSQVSVDGDTHHITLKETKPGTPSKHKDGAPTWDGRSDNLAAILLNRPFRLIRHASDLVPADG